MQQMEAHHFSKYYAMTLHLFMFGWSWILEVL